MIRTLHLYLSRDLAKIGLMALIAFTVVMTVFGVAEPLRERGLSGSQVLSLFGFTVPMMFSLTLPIAALFASTFVYGKFSQANEYLAARASGISALNLLQPAVFLGMIITICSLLLSNHIVPTMAGRVEHVVTANVESYLFHQLKQERHVEYGNYVIHADEMHEESNTLRGVIAADKKSIHDVNLLVAPAARIHFDREHGDTYATFYLIDASMARTDSYDLYRVGNITPPSRELPSLAEEKPSYYDWSELQKTLQDPSRNSEIKGLLADVRRQFCTETIADRVAAAINAGETYRFSDTRNQYVYELSAGGAEIDEKGSVRLLSQVVDDTLRRVRVVKSRDNRNVKSITADSGTVDTEYSAQQKSQTISLRLSGHVREVLSPDQNGADPIRRSEWGVWQLQIPEDILSETGAIDLDEIYEHPEDFTRNRRKLNLLANRIVRLQGKIRAEMNSRIAYSLSCWLLVSMGAALGLIFRGGQVVSAFTLSVIPAAIIIVMIVMGKQMMVNPDVSPLVGVASIWGGLILLLIGNLFIYGKLLRR